LGIAARRCRHAEIRPGRDCDLDSVVVHSAWFARADVLPPSLVVAVALVPDQFKAAGAFDATRLAAPDPSRPKRLALGIPIAARGRYVLIVAQLGHNALFCDEVEIHGRPAPPLAAPETATNAPARKTDIPATEFSEAEMPRALAAQRRLWAMRTQLPVPSTAVVASRDPAARKPPDSRRARRNGAAPATAASRCGVSIRGPHRRRGASRCRQSPTRSTCGPGAWGAAAFEIANASPTEMRLGVAPGTHSTGAPGVVLRDVVGVQGRDTGWACDALPKAADTLGVRPGEVRQIWVDVDARKARPGRYRLPVRIGGQTVALPVRVHDLRLPPPPLGAIDWTYAREFALPRLAPEAAVADNRDHGIDIWCLSHETVPWPDPAAIDAAGHLQRRPDFSRCDAELALYDARHARAFGWYWDFKIDQKDPSLGRFKHPYRSPAWQRAVSEWLAAWMEHLARAGYDPQRVFMQVIDERTGANVVELYRALHAARADLRLALTVTRTATPDELRALQSELAVVILEREALERHQDWIRAMTAGGAAIWSYDVIEPSKTMAPGAMYRLLAWESWARQLGGCGFWAYGDTGPKSADAWDDFDAQRGDFAVVYGAVGAAQPLGDEVFAPSKRWQAFRIGMQETALLEASLARRPGLRDELRAAFAQGQSLEPEALRRQLLRGR
jgi:hypothetical protein